MIFRPFFLATVLLYSQPPRNSSPVLTRGGHVALSSVSGKGHTVDFTRLGDADWFEAGGSTGNPDTCGYNGPCATARKLGGSGLIAAINTGPGDGWFYPISPNLITMNWSDGTTPPSNIASHINNTFVQIQAFAGTQQRVVTVVAGLLGAGKLLTTVHLTDGVTTDVTLSEQFVETGVHIFTIPFSSASAGRQLVVTFAHQGGELLLYGAALAGDLPPQVHNLELTDSLPGFLGAVTRGDTLVLPDGYAYTGHLVLPGRRDSGWVEIRSTLRVPDGQRVGPEDLKVVLSSPDEQPIIQNDYQNASHAKRSTHGWRFVGLEITSNNRKASLNYGLIVFGFGDQAEPGDISHDITFERCYIHGDGVHNYIKGIVGNANNLSILDSYISGFTSSFMEANAINVYTSAGPLRIINNYLEATGENVMIGGSGPDVGPALTPTNGLIQRNYFNKLPSWRGGPFIIKNLLEFKNGYNFSIDSNLFDNCWAAAQNGFAILFTPRTGQGGTIENHVDTITFTNNIVRHSGSGINLGSYDDLAKDASGQSIPPARLRFVHDVLIRNNLFDDLSVSYAPFSHGVQIFGPPKNFVLDHNTFNFRENVNDHGWWLVGETGMANSNAQVTGNAFGADLYGDSRGPSTAVLKGAVFNANNIRNASPDWRRTAFKSFNTFNTVQPKGIGANIPDLTAIEKSVRAGTRSLLN